MKSLFLILLSIFTVTLPTSANDGLILDDPEDDKIKKFMVIALLGSVENRRTLEDEIAIDLNLQGVNAFSSYTTNLTTGDKITKEMVIKVCEETDSDGIILVQVLSQSQSSGYSTRAYQQYGQFYYWGVFAFYYGPGYEMVETNDAVVRSDVITIPEGKVVYNQSSNVTVGGDVEKIILGFSEKLTKKIVKKKLAVVNQED